MGKHLSPAEKTVILEKKQAGTKTNEIAQALGTSDSTVNKVLREFRDKGISVPGRRSRVGKFTTSGKPLLFRKPALSVESEDSNPQVTFYKERVSEIRLQLDRVERFIAAADIAGDKELSELIFKEVDTLLIKIEVGETR
jgi:DNA-binding MarR family transcriptional regulator